MIASVAFRFRTMTESDGSGTPAAQNPKPFAFGTARRSFCHVHEISLGNRAKSAAAESPSQPGAKSRGEAARVRVAGYPSSDGKCSHLVVAEHGVHTKKLELDSTRRVEVRQPFHAEAGDELSFDSVVLLKPGRGFGTAAKVHAVVVNLATQDVDVMLHRTSDNGRHSGKRPTGSKLRETFTLPLLVAGEYELRTTTSIESACAGAVAHLLISSVRITDSRGTERQRLASLICVGRVSQ